MIFALELRTGLWIFIAIAFSFTIGLLSLRSDRIWNGAPYWLAGNATSIVALMLLLWMQQTPFPARFSVVPAGIIILGNMLKTASLMRPGQRSRTLLVGLGLVVCYVLAVRLFDAQVEANLTLGLPALIAAVPPAWQAALCRFSPRWRDLDGSRLFAATGLTLSIYFVLIASRGFQVHEGRFLFQQSGLAQLNLLATLIYFVVIHVSLIAMLAARVSRIVAAGQMRQRKQQRLTQQAELHGIEMANAAAERQALLDVLTHEVRQPLNNAQAALHDVMMTVLANSRDYAAAQRLQSIIDQIVLALSNAIVGASMLERKSASLLVRTDLPALVELACSDVGMDWRDRIEVIGTPGSIFADADPILLRLAIRNLLDNALKHSPEDEKVVVEIVEDDGNLAIAIVVSNVPAKSFTPSPSLFERGVRGAEARDEGKGLGLYIVQEVAVLHDGQASASVDADGRTAFRLSIGA